MKWCCSRYTSGVTLGSIYIVGSVVVFTLGIISFVEFDHVEDPKRRQYLKSKAIETMIFCGITALISSLFIVATVKRSHYLIVPWLLLGVYIFYITLRTIYWWFIGAAMGGATGIEFLILLLTTVLAFAIEVAIFCFSWSVFRKIRNENIEKSERLKHQMADKTLI